LCRVEIGPDLARRVSARTSAGGCPARDGAAVRLLSAAPGGWWFFIVKLLERRNALRLLRHTG